MPRRRLKADPRQMPLLYDKTPDGVVALRAVDWRITGVSRLRWCQVRELAAAVLWCGACDGCRASVRKLIDVMNKNRVRRIVRSERTFFRIREAALAMGVMVDEPEHNESGRTFSERAVCLKRIKAMVTASQQLAHRQRSAAVTATFLISGKVAVTWQTPSSLYKPSNSGRPKIKTRRPEMRLGTKKTRGGDVPPVIDSLSVRRVASEIERACGGCQSQRDWEFAVKVAMLSSSLGERWLKHALGGLATCRHKNGWAYLTTCLGENTALLGKRLNRELARLTIPAELRSYQRPEKPERLCVAEDPV